MEQLTSSLTTLREMYDRFHAWRKLMQISGKSSVTTDKDDVIVEVGEYDYSAEYLPNEPEFRAYQLLVTMHDASTVISSATGFSDAGV